MFYVPSNRLIYDGFREHAYCQPGLDKYISTSHRMIPEHSLRLVNREASGIVQDTYKGMQAVPYYSMALGRYQQPILVNYRKDMMFPVDGNPEPWNRSFPIAQQLDPADNLGIVRHLRHLALRLFDFANWPSPHRAARFNPPAAHYQHRSPWFRAGFMRLLQKARKLETFHIVVDHLYSSATFGPDDDATAADERSPQLVSSHSEMFDVVKSLPRDKYGFSDYHVFASKTQLDMVFARSCSPPPHSKAAVMSFAEYDPFIQEVRNQAHAYSNPPIRKRGNVEVRLVVDLDSNMNGGDMGLVPRRMAELSLAGDGGGDGGERLVKGYDRYFARPSARDWWADVSGDEIPKTKQEESESDYLPDSGSEDDSDSDL